jgi:hypothetical protein
MIKAARPSINGGVAAEAETGARNNAPSATATIRRDIGEILKVVSPDSGSKESKAPGEPRPGGFAASCGEKSPYQGKRPGKSNLDREDLLMRKPIAVVASLLALFGTMTVLPAHAAEAVYVVGAAKRSINPNNADGTWGVAHEKIHLGGYGFGNGTIPGFGERVATGVLGPGVNVRAFVVSTDAKPAHALAIAEIEAQGYFIAYQEGPYGMHDIRKQVAGEVGIPEERVILASNHTHGGPDTIGVWGGVPKTYLEFVASQTVAAIKAAWVVSRPAHLYFGTTAVGDGSTDDLIANQFGYDPANAKTDDEMRVLQARDATTQRPFATFVNLSAHPTVMGDQTLVSADWPGPAAEQLATLYGGEAIAVPGTLGRSQPNDGPSYDACERDEYCALDHYAGRVVAAVGRALAGASALTGDPIVDGHSYLIEEPLVHNAILLAATSPAGKLIGVPIDRALTPPWSTATVLGTVTSSARIGNILITGGPGEYYPQVTEALTNATPFVGGRIMIGLSGDQLGYILAPLPDAYPEPIRRSFFDGNPSDPTTWNLDPVGNDNYFFNVSHTLGERLICSMLRGAGEMFGLQGTVRDARTLCAAFITDALLPAGADTLVP